MAVEMSLDFRVRLKCEQYVRRPEVIYGFPKCVGDSALHGPVI